MHKTLIALALLAAAPMGAGCASGRALGPNFGSQYGTFVRNQWNNKSRDVDPLGGDEAQRLMQTYRGTFTGADGKEEGGGASGGSGGGFLAQPTKTNEGASMMRVR